MFELNGKYNYAKVFTDMADEASISQIINICNLESLNGCKIRMMPDVHAGAGCTIGTTIQIKDTVIPNLVGFDIGCGMLTFRLERNSEIDLPAIDKFIREKIPNGFSIREYELPIANSIDLKLLKCSNHVNIDRARKSIGTLGGGNHFIEINKDKYGYKYLVIHTGSRNLGKQVCEYYQKLAIKDCTDNTNEVKAIIDELKLNGKENEIEAALKNIKKEKISKELCHLEGKHFKDYIYDMKITQSFASINRLAIGNEILKHFNLNYDYSFETIHNYIDTDSMILRKGAIAARKGEIVLIPINMKDGSIIAAGHGNPDWNYSAPHGAGRLYSRSLAKDTFSLDEFKKSMDGIYTSSVCESTIDESPMAYKPISSIINNISDTVKIIDILKPIYNFKAS